MSSKRERIAPNGEVRFVRRDERGRFKESDDVGTKAQGGLIA